MKLTLKMIDPSLLARLEETHLVSQVQLLTFSLSTVRHKHPLMRTILSCKYCQTGGDNSQCALWRLRLEDHNSEASLDCIMRPCLNVSPHPTPSLFMKSRTGISNVSNAYLSLLYQFITGFIILVFFFFLYQWCTNDQIITIRCVCQFLREESWDQLPLEWALLGERASWLLGTGWVWSGPEAEEHLGSALASFPCYDKMLWPKATWWKI